MDNYVDNYRVPSHQVWVTPALLRAKSTKKDYEAFFCQLILSYYSDTTHWYISYTDTHFIQSSYNDRWLMKSNQMSRFKDLLVCHTYVWLSQKKKAGWTCMELWFNYPCFCPHQYKLVKMFVFAMAATMLRYDNMMEYYDITFIINRARHCIIILVGLYWKWPCFVMNLLNDLGC